MCDEISGADVALGEVGGAIEGLVGFVLKNAIPVALAVVADVVLVFTIQHWVVVTVCMSVALLAATVGRVMLARWLLKVMGRLVVPCGFEKLNPAAAAKRRPVRRIALVARPAVAIPVKIRPGIPAANAEALMIAATTEALETPAASVTINGTRYPVLGKREGR
jgi:hypothetical protein